MSELLKKIKELEEILKGGSGSGNFGHSGIPGKRGGSAPKGDRGALPTSGKRVSIPRFQIEQEKIEKSLKSPQTVKELKSAVKKLTGQGDYREDIGEILKRNGYHYENSYNTVTGGGDNYYRGRFNINVDFTNGKTISTIEES